MLDLDDVAYIDKSYVHTLDYFRKAKATAERLIQENEPAKTDFSRWREDIRDMVVRVRAQFVQFVDEFVLKLKKNLLDIEK